jgi:hypothetical protein
VYALKRQLGQQLVLVSTSGDAVNLLTGLKSNVQTSVTINYAVNLPSNMVRGANYDLSYIIANRQFTYGAYHDTRTRKVLIDRRDIPSTFPVDLNMHVVFQNKRWEIKNLEEYEELECIVLLMEQLEGSLVRNQITASLSDSLGLGETIGKTFIP